MGQAQPFHSEHSNPIDPLISLRQLLTDLETGEAPIVKDGIDATSTYVMVLKTQIQHLEILLEE